jgi:tetratricopeptide (TPR) repeat protein
MPKTVCFVLIFLIAALAACRSNAPEKSSANNAEAIKSFYIGLAAMQAADDSRAKDELNKTVNLAPGEPAGWANLGILQMRQKDFEPAAASFEKAKNLAPAEPKIYWNLAVLETQRGNFDKAMELLSELIRIEPDNVHALYALAQEKERQADDQKAFELYQSIVTMKPENIAAQVEIVRLSAKLNKGEILQHAVYEIDRVLNQREPVPVGTKEKENQDLSPEARERLDALQKSSAGLDLKQAAIDASYLRNVLLREPIFRAAIAEIKPSDTTIGEPFTKPLKLTVPDFSPAEPDLALTFSAHASENIKANFAKAVFLNGDNPPVVAWSNEKETRVGKASLPVSAANSNQICAIDFDYDFKNDLAFATEKGFRLFKQIDGENFTDVTTQTKLANEILQKSYSGAWTFDVESDGDLDLILAGNDAPVVLQNNSDGSFSVLKTFGDSGKFRDFASADIDEDGDADALILWEGGGAALFVNERGGLFKSRGLPLLTPALAIGVGDANSDGKLDLLILLQGDWIMRLSDKMDEQEFEIGRTVAGQFCSAGRSLANKCSLKLYDLDNNGANDFLISNDTETQIFLAGKDKNFSPLPNKINSQISTIAETNGDGKLDLIGIDGGGKPTVFQNNSQKNYGWQILRPRSARAEGDQRVNSFGIGGEMEIRSGLLAQKQIISSPQVHFGLGEQTSTDLLRIIWGNGFTQAEFDLGRDQQILIQQRLTGSCPHLFAWNGSEFKLVKDSAPLGTSLGLRISGTETLPVTQTEEWYKIPGERLAPRGDFYELRITDELWESYYVDSYSLMVIDHPQNTEVFANELYPIPADLRVFTTSKPKPFARATDEKGQDVTNLVENLDEIYLGTFERARYQGVAKEHFVELELPPDAPENETIDLIADGWLHPTDTSLNVAISQSNYEKPKGLSLDVQDENGAWKTIKDDFGVPAGKLKTIVVELPKGARRCRLRTNSEIFWDKLAWAMSVPDAENETRRLDLSQAELRFRGFSVIDKKDDSSPEIPDYSRIATTTQRWRSIEGYYTRYGDILELLAGTDDRYALVGSGDEMLLRFAALPPVGAGFERDFVIIGVGWIKEGDYNNVFSKTVLPLPTHATNDYTRPPTRLEDDPVYQKNKQDWLNFHTRYVAPDLFRNALRDK